jgi:short-subunit dehydrogenase
VDNAADELESLVVNADVAGIDTDFSKVDEVYRLISSLPEVDIIINNSGIFEPKRFVQMKIALNFLKLTLSVVSYNVI